MKKLLVLTSTILLSALALSAETYGGLANGPGTYYGTGNTNTGWTVSTNGNLELGLGGLLRYLGPLGQAGHVYYAPNGLTTVAGHTGSAWGFDFSANTNVLQAAGAPTLANYDFTFSIADVTKGTLLAPIPLAAFGALSHPTGLGSCPALPAPPTPGCGVNADQGFQDASSLHYLIGKPANALLQYNTDDGDLYRITLTANNAVGGGEAGSVSIDVQVAPEPGTWLMFGTGLTALGLMRRRSLLRK